MAAGSGAAQQHRERPGRPRPPARRHGPRRFLALLPCLVLAVPVFRGIRAGPRAAAAFPDGAWAGAPRRIAPLANGQASTRLDACLPSVFGAPPHGPVSAPWEENLTPRKDAWTAAHGGLDTARRFLRDRLRGWPQRLLVDCGALPSGDSDLLRRLTLDTWRGLDALTDAEHELPIDWVGFGPVDTSVEAAWIGDYTSPTNIGLYLMSLAGASDLGFLSPEEAAGRARRVLDTLERLPAHEGFFFNFYDTTTLERTSSFLSFVDSAWLTAGLIVARNAFPDVAARASRLIAAADYRFFHDPDTGLVSHGYALNTASPAGFHYGVLYTEARLGVLIAIGKGDVPATTWYRMLRTVPPACGCRAPEPVEIRTRVERGIPVAVGHHEWGGYRYVPSWGGSMFEALMPVLVLDELRHAPRSLGPNGVAHALVQQQYARTYLDYPVWGLSPSAAVDGRGYGEFGVPVLGGCGYDPGPVSPHAAALALLVIPDAAVANLREIVRRYDAYGEYGLYDAIEPLTGRVARRYLQLDQAMLFLALVNHLTGGSIQRRFEADPIVQVVLPLLADETFFDGDDPLPLMCAGGPVDRTPPNGHPVATP